MSWRLEGWGHDLRWRPLAAWHWVAAPKAEDQGRVGQHAAWSARQFSSLT
jgi:hypothetical protein